MSLLSADLALFYSFAREIEPGTVRSIFGLAATPFISAFVWESAQYFKHAVPATDALLRQHEDLLLTSRQRFKLLDDRQKSLDEILSSAEELAAINSEWFLNMHHGLLGTIKKMFQPDLGIYFLNGQVICTTHVAMMNLGMTKESIASESHALETLGPYMYAVGINLGTYAELLRSSLNIQLPREQIDVENPLPAVQCRDLRSKRFYKLMGSRIASGNKAVSIFLTAVLSHVNTARVLVPLIAGTNDLAVFKLGFVSLFHAASALEKILDRHNVRPFLQSDAEEIIRSTIGDSAVGSVQKNRQLRNNLVHYGVPKSVSPRLSASLPLFGLIEAHDHSESLQGLGINVKRGLDRVAINLRLMLPDGLSPEETL